MVQAEDSWIKQLKDIIEKRRSERTGGESSMIQGYEMRDGILYRAVETRDGDRTSVRKLFVVPRAMRKYVVVMCHDRAGHFGVDKTLALIRERYWFPQMVGYVKQHVRVCVECIFNKDFTGRREGLCNPITPERRPFQKLYIDHMGLLPKSGCKEHIIVVVDGFSKFVLLEAVHTTKDTAVIRLLQKVFARYGLPDVVVTDRGTAFTSNVFVKFLEERAVKHSLTSTQHPQANGQVERMNKEVARLLRTTCVKPDKSDWASRLEIVPNFINRAVAKSTGKAPFEVLHGYLPRLDNFSTVVDGQQPTVWQPSREVQDRIRGAIENAQADFKKYYDRTGNAMAWVTWWWFVEHQR